MSERNAMIKGHQRLSVSRQCHLLAVPRSSVYARPRGVSAADVELMRQLDALSRQWPFYGSRRLCEELCQRGERVNRKRVRRLMRLMGLRAVYPKPRTSQPGKGHKIYPSLLNGLTIDRPNQVWASDICYGAPSLRGMSWRTRPKPEHGWNVKERSQEGRLRYPLFATEEREPKRRCPAVHWQGAGARGKRDVRRSRYAKKRL
jgi:hypothetical protein